MCECPVGVDVRDGTTIVGVVVQRHGRHVDVGGTGRKQQGGVKWFEWKGVCCVCTLWWVECRM